MLRLFQTNVRLETADHQADAEPDKGAMGKWLRSPRYADHSGSHWFSKASLELLGGLLTSMTQYRPSDRPTAAEVLEHPWFRRHPSLEACPLMPKRALVQIPMSHTKTVLAYQYVDAS